MSFKEKLLEIGLCIDNEYLDKYVELIDDNRNTKCEKFITQKHHIIPRFYYKYSKMKVDNSHKNIVNLTYQKHLLAHYYLMKCSKTTLFELCNANAIYKNLNNKHIKNVEYCIKYNTDLLNQINKRRCELIALHHYDCSGENNSRARAVYVYDINTRQLVMQFGTQGIAAKALDISNVKERINKSKYGIFIYDDRIVTKKYPLDEDALTKELDNRKLINSHIRQDRFFKCRICGKTYMRRFNDIDYKKYLYEYNKGHGCCPDCNKNGNFFRGKQKNEQQKLRMSASARGRHWINNGILQKQVHDDVLNTYLNDGWKFGQLHKQKDN